MLPRQHRLAKSADIKQVLRHGQRVTTKYLRLHYDQQANPGPTRIACIVSKRVAKTAVIRHRYQRWLRAALAELAPHLPPAHDLVIIAQPPIQQLKTQLAVQQTVRDALAKVTPHA